MLVVKAYYLCANTYLTVNVVAKEECASAATSAFSTEMTRA